MIVLKNRSDFLAIANGMRANCKAFILQALKFDTDTSSISTEPRDMQIRVGFTVTKKVGNAPTRNRIKRRLKAAWQMAYPRAAKPGYDYVLFGKQNAVMMPFDSLVQDLTGALHRIVKSGRGNNSVSNNHNNRDG